MLHFVTIKDYRRQFLSEPPKLLLRRPVSERIVLICFSVSVPV